MAKPKRSEEIDAYLARTQPESRALLRALRKTIHAVVPGVPAFRFRAKVIAELD